MWVNHHPTLNGFSHPYLGDVGGQRTLRPYWRNYFEQTDAIVWVVDSGDRMRMQDCKDELHSLLLEDVCFRISCQIDIDLPRVYSDYLVLRFWSSPTNKISKAQWPTLKFEMWVCTFLIINNCHLCPSQALDLRSIKTHNWKIWSCSAITGDNLVHGLDWVVNDIAGRLYYSSTTKNSQNEGTTSVL